MRTLKSIQQDIGDKLNEPIRNHPQSEVKFSLGDETLVKILSFHKFILVFDKLQLEIKRTASPILISPITELSNYNPSN